MYNGHQSYNAWNVSLWIHNDEGLYNLAKDAIRRCDTRDEAAREILDTFNGLGMTHTPDGVPWTFTNIRAALVGWED